MAGLLGRRPALILRSAFLLLFVLFIVYVSFFANWAPHSLGDVKRDLEAFGPGAPVVAVFMQAIGVMLLIPGFLLILATAVLFGLDAVWISLAGQTLGAMGAFLIARHVGRDLIHAVLGQHLIALERLLENHAFRSLLLLRLLSILPGPFIVYAPGLVRVPMRQVFVAAVIGQVPFVIALAYVGDSVANVEDASQLLTPEFLVPMVAMGALILLPVAIYTLVKTRRRKRALQESKPLRSGLL